MRPRCQVIALAMYVSLASAVSAQAHTFDLRLAEFDSNGHRTYHNFIYVFTPGAGRLLFEGNHLRLPRIGYHETSAGVGYRVVSSEAGGAYLIGHLGRGSDRQTYFLPALFGLWNHERWTASAFAMHYMPFDEDGVSQWLLDPVELLYRLVGDLQVGLSSYYWRPEGGPALIKLGGQAGYAIGRFTPLVAVRHANDPAGVEVQLRIVAVF